MLAGCIWYAYDEIPNNLKCILNACVMHVQCNSMHLKCNWNTCVMHMKWILNAPECILNAWIKHCVCSWDAILKYMQCICYASEIHFETFSIHAETIVMYF